MPIKANVCSTRALYHHNLNGLDCYYWLLNVHGNVIHIWIVNGVNMLHPFDGSSCYQVYTTRRLNYKQRIRRKRKQTKRIVNKNKRERERVTLFFP